MMALQRIQYSGTQSPAPPTFGFACSSSNGGKAGSITAEGVLETLEGSEVIDMVARSSTHNAYPTGITLFHRACVDLVARQSMCPLCRFGGKVTDVKSLKEQNLFLPVLGSLCSFSNFSLHFLRVLSLLDFAAILKFLLKLTILKLCGGKAQALL